SQHLFCNSYIKCAGFIPVTERQLPHVADKRATQRVVIRWVSQAFSGILCVRLVCPKFCLCAKTDSLHLTKFELVRFDEFDLVFTWMGATSTCPNTTR